MMETFAWILFIAIVVVLLWFAYALLRPTRHFAGLPKTTRVVCAVIAIGYVIFRVVQTIMLYL